MNDLRLIFRTVWNQLGLTGDWEKAWRVRERRYAQPWRYYHTLDHVRHMVNELKPIMNKLERPTEVLLEAIDHDVVLVPAITGKPVTRNEFDSAIFSLMTVVDTGGEFDAAIRIAIAIMATDHKPQELNDDTKYLLDADMAILGQRWAVYGQYALRDIPQEYSDCGVTSEAFTTGRLAFLRDLLQRPIYLTNHFRQLYEDSARLNIEQEVRILTEKMSKA